MLWRRTFSFSINFLSPTTTTACRFGGETSDRKTIIYLAHGQLEKNIIDYHEQFEQAQTE